MSDEQLLNKARKYRKEGYDHGKIRQYLSDEGYEAKTISRALRDLDSEEIHELYLAQKLKSARNQFYTALVLLVVGSIVSIYYYVASDRISVEIIAPIGLVLFTWHRMEDMAKRTYSTKAIIREHQSENRRSGK